MGGVRLVLGRLEYLFSLGITKEKEYSGQLITMAKSDMGLVIWEGESDTACALVS